LILTAIIPSQVLAQQLGFRAGSFVQVLGKKEVYLTSIAKLPKRAGLISDRKRHAVFEV
jgi:hypothetical protein